MTEAEFHRARRMFVVLGASNDGSVLVAPPDMPLTHIEWFIRLFGTTAANSLLAKAVRGYTLSGRLVAYTGQDFLHYVDHQHALLAVTLMHAISPIHQVAFGAKPGPNQPWEPKTPWQSIEKYVHSVEQMRKQLKVEVPPTTGSAK